MPNQSRNYPTDQNALRERVKAWNSNTDWKELTANALQKITHQEGVDFATTLLYERLRQSPENGPVIREIECMAQQGGNSSPIRDIEVIIVPGGFHEKNTDSRKCLRLVFDEIARLGLPVRIVPTLNIGSVDENAEIIRSWMQSKLKSKAILVSLSKGTAEVKWALHVAPQLFERIGAWVNVSGLLFGSEWVTWLLNRRISRFLAHFWCWSTGCAYSTLEQLRRGPNTLLDIDLVAPADTMVMHIAGFPLTGSLTHRYSKRSFMRLSERGPNDGMGLMLGDFTRAGGHIYPVWNADHFLRPDQRNIRHFVGPVLNYVALRCSNV